MKLKVTAILRILVERTYDIDTKKDCIDKMAKYFKLSEKANTLRKRLHHNDIIFTNAVEMFDYLKYSVYAVNKSEKICLPSTEIAIQSIGNIMKNNRVSKADLARSLGVSYRAVMAFFKQANLKTETIVKIFNALNYEVVVEAQEAGRERFIVGNGYWEDYKFNAIYREAESFLLSEVI